MAECYGGEGQLRGAKPTCRVAVASLEVVLEFPGAGSGVSLMGWRLGPGEGAEPLLSAGGLVPCLSL